MAIKKKYAKGRLDKYYQLAKEQGYRARSAFKLIQLNNKYHFLENSKCLIDLCAAPGGWCQVAGKYMPKPNLIIGLDLVPIKPIPGVITHVEDITTIKCRNTLRQELKTWKADVVLHDGAPNVGRAWLHDAFTQSELVLASLKLATEFLIEGGTFVTKVFRSQDYNKLLWVFNQFFEKVDATKPASSRNVSAEIFVVCRKFRAPKKIDPKLLDPKYIFKDVTDEDFESGKEDDDEGNDENALIRKAKVKREKQGALLNDLLHPEKRKRHRSGYNDGDYTLHTSFTVEEFATDKDGYLSVLSNANSLVFDDSEISNKIKNHRLTTDEIKELCSDIKVLGKKEFKTLLKWREQIRVAIGISQQDALSENHLKKEKTENDDEDIDNKKLTEEQLEEVLEKEMKKQAARIKKDKRKDRERKAKQLLRMRLGMGGPNDIGEEQTFDSLGFKPEFDLGHGSESEAEAEAESDSEEDIGNDKAKLAVKYKDLLDKVLSDSDEETETLKSKNIKSKLNKVEQQEEEEDYYGILDSDEEKQKYLNNIENDLDLLYAEFDARRDIKNTEESTKKKKENDAKQQFEEWYGTEFGSNKDLEQNVEENADAEDDSGDDSSSDEEEIETETKHLNKKRKVESVMDVDFNEKYENISEDELDDNELIKSTKSNTGSKNAQMFFDNPLFKDIMEESAVVNSKSNKKTLKNKNFDTQEKLAKLIDEEDDDEHAIAKMSRARKVKLEKENEKQESNDTDEESEIDWSGKKDTSKKDKDGFELVKAHDPGQNEEFQISTAEAYTLAKKVISQSGKRNLIDDSYNRYTFEDDTAVLPSWFVKDEHNHFKKPLPVSKESIQVMKERYRQLNARPVKKVAEAKFRKQLRAQRRLDKMQKKAESILDNEDGERNERSKMLEVAKLVRKAKNKTQDKKPELVVAKGANKGNKGRPKGIKGRYKMVDPRMKKDLKAMKRKEKRTKSKRKR